MTETVCGFCGHTLVPKRPGPGGLDLWEDHECPEERRLTELYRERRDAGKVAP